MILSRRRIFPAAAALAVTGAASAQPVPPSSQDQGGNDDDPAMVLKLVILDIGGTLIADHGEVPEAMLGAFSRHGITVTPQEFAAWRGASKRTMVKHFVAREKKSADLIAPIYDDFTAHATAAYEKVQPIAGAEEALKELRAMGLILATTTGFDRPLATAILARLGWQHYFAASVTSDDVAEGRPAPFMLFRAMEGARVNDVRQVMAVGDTVLDLEAADNAGVGAAIGVWSGAATESRLREARNSGVLPSVAALPGLIKTGLPLSHCR
jgi:phosphonatase-like hydrolase